ncbi:acyl-CoA dehydrogenase family protein [Stutzerimonas kirkiae]|uniref:acyl-CoA dehydrogenase family protein n=1 Tax=Stutzerimonas kirkiae TaxID=2211392 RepID=UPI0010384376|nr:acyl-CoA dehydrogenase family protein [Stutzerimonas kirkiae]TBV10917.1 monooxygenase [Stutzerimonas kirkiae]
MANRQNAATAEHAPDHAQLAERFRPVFQRIAEGALERERNRTLPFEPIEWLRQAGFGAVRVPRAEGGSGASLPQLFRLLIELSAADSNLTQALRAHFGFVEDRLVSTGDEQRQRWLKRFVDGELVGGAWTETGNVGLGQVITQVSPRADGSWRLNGRKFYSTGSIYADWLDIYAQRSDTGEDVIAVTRARQPGIQHSDDWDGFGQRTTGSGTSVFEDAEVEAGNVIPFGTRFKYQTAFYQVLLLSILAGIGRAAANDAARLVRERTRVFSHGNAPRVADDVQVQQVVGQLGAQAYAAEAIVLRAAEALQAAYDSHFLGDAEAEHQANIDAELESAQAQLVVSELVLRASSDLFNALGASAAREALQLDRHWRNARTISSHNPLIYKARIVGDWLINGNEPPYVWQIGNGTRG